MTCCRERGSIMNKDFIKKYFVPLFDICLVGVSYVFAILIRFDFNIGMFRSYYVSKEFDFLIVFFVHLLFYYALHINKTVWSKTSLNEFMRVVTMNLFSGMVVIMLMLLSVLRHHSFSITFIMVLLNTLLMFTARALYRYLRMFSVRMSKKKTAKHIIIYGAGSSGRMIYTEILENPSHDYHVVGFIDDKPALHRSQIFGVPVFGGKEMLDFVLDTYEIDEVIVAMPSVAKPIRTEILKLLTSKQVITRVLSSTVDLLRVGDFRKALRDVNVLDLLGRPEIVIDDEEMANIIKGKTILVTGAGGSIGSEIVRQIVVNRPKRIILIDMNETGLYGIQQEIIMNSSHLIAPEDVRVLIKSIRNHDPMDRVFEKYKPDIVFHAAAHKHVPLMEYVPEEAIKNNILGTYNMIKIADKHKVKTFVNISTDKAVNPTNVMGATKRFNEMMIQAFNVESETNFVAVRFGNVLGSNGSVVPLFKQQIAKGGPVTVTHPDITRYFMTIPEAVSLVLQSCAYAKGGEIFVLDMGEPVKIVTMAEKLIELSGFVPYRDIRIEYVGLRPGEKLYEELLMDEEGMQTTPNHLIYIAKPGEHTRDEIELCVQRFEASTHIEDFDHRSLLKQFVPTYKEV